MTEQKSNFYYYALLGTGAALTCAVVFYLTVPTDKLGEYGDLDKEIKAIKKDIFFKPNQPTIPFDQLIKMTKAIYKSYEFKLERTSSWLERFNERKDFFLKQEWDNYNRCVMKQKQRELKILEKVKNRALLIGKVDQRVFTESLAQFENNQNSYKTLKDARVSHYLSKDQPSLSRKDTLQCFKDLENEKTELMIKAYRCGEANFENKQQYQQLCTVQEVRA